jgi:hypothetical protein
LDERLAEGLSVVRVAVEPPSDHAASIFVEEGRKDTGQSTLIGRRIQQVDATITRDITALTRIPDSVPGRSEESRDVLLSWIGGMNTVIRRIQNAVAVGILSEGKRWGEEYGDDQPAQKD